MGIDGIIEGVSHTVILWRRSGGLRFSSVARSYATEIITHPSRNTFEI